MKLANRSTDFGLGGTNRDSSSPSPGVAISRYGSGQRVFGNAGGPISTSRLTRSG
jgi:hypothetical protein